MLAELDSYGIHFDYFSVEIGGKPHIAVNADRGNYRGTPEGFFWRILAQERGKNAANALVDRLTS
jgi:hypothetical protein